MKREHLRVESERDIDRLAEADVVRRVFGTADHFTRLYFSQVNCTEFGTVSIPRAHCLDTFNLIQDFIWDVRADRPGKAKHNLPPKFLINFEDEEAVPLAGLLRHVPQDKSAAKALSLNESAERFWYILRAYHNFDRIIISRYATRTDSDMKKKVRRLGELTPEDKVDIGLLNTFIEDEFKAAPGRIPEFYILLFFDVYSAFRYFTGEGASDPGIDRHVLERMSHFVLILMPPIIGEYRFGEYNSDLKDLAFRNLHPEYYLATKTSIERNLPSKEWYPQIENGLKEIADSFEHPVSISHRMKGVYSAYQKSLRYATPVKELWDLIAFRAVIDSEEPESCYQFLSRLEEKFNRWPDPRGYTDYVARPKSNGYQSVHIVLESESGSLAEVQIRTSKMNLIAEFGAASHLVYKGGSNDIDSTEPTPQARYGRQILERLLGENGLTINDFINHLGASLEHIPVEHYYEGIASKMYDPALMVGKILKDRSSVKEIGDSP